MANALPNTNHSKSSDHSAQPKSPSKWRLLKVTGLVLVAVFVLLLIIGSFASQVPQYLTSDLVSETKDKITFSRPKQWQDASSATKLKTDYGLNANNAVIFGDEVVTNKNGEVEIPNAFVMFGQSSDSSTTDVALFQDAAVRAEFEKVMDAKLTADSFKSDECVAIDHFSKNYNYDLNNMPVSIALNVNCRLSDAQKKKLNADSIEMRMAIVIANNGQTYVYALIASDKSWAKNEPVYLQMLEDFKAQP